MMNSCGLTAIPDIKVATVLHLCLSGSAQSVLFKNSTLGSAAISPTDPCGRQGGTLSAVAALIVKISVFTWDCSCYKPTG